MKVVMAPHDPKWAGRYDAAAREVARALGSNLVAVHHIGSTAIPTVWAKPVIDILVEAADLEAIEAQDPAMEALGYEGLGELGIAGRRYFRRNDGAGVRTHQVHVFAAGCAEVKRHIAFRDFMVRHPEWAERYSDLKRKLAEAHRDDSKAYMDGKDAFIREIDRRAAAWSAKR